MIFLMLKHVVGLSFLEVSRDNTSTFVHRRQCLISRRVSRFDVHLTNTASTQASAGRIFEISLILLEKNLTSPLSYFLFFSFSHCKSILAVRLGKASLNETTEVKRLWLIKTETKQLTLTHCSILL